MNELRIIKLFGLQVSAIKAASYIDLCCATVLRGFNLIRKNIISTSKDWKLILRGEVEADESYFGGRRKRHRGRACSRKAGA